jgi:hypothetical protein
MMKLACLTAVACLSACGGSSSGADAGPDSGVPAFDGGPGTLWLLLNDGDVVGIDTHDGHQVKQLASVGAYSGGDGVLAVGGGSLWFQGDNAVRGVDLASGVARDVPGSRAKYPAYGAGAVWWADEGVIGDPNPIYRYDPTSGATTHTNGGGVPNGTGGLIAAGAEGCWSLYFVVADGSRGVAHVKPDGSAVTNISLPGAQNLLLGASVVSGNGRGYALTNTMTNATRKLFAIDAATDTITAQRDVTTPEFGANGLLALEDHLLFGEGALWYVDSYGEKLHELDPVTLASRRTLPFLSTSKQAAVGAGAAWGAGESRQVVRTDLATGAQVAIPLPGEFRTMVFQAP